MEFRPNFKEQYAKLVDLLEPDIELDFIDEKIKINRYVLMSKSQYFAKTFTNEFMGSDSKCIEMHIADDECRKNIIRYLQDKEVSTSSDNVPQLCEVASYYELTDLRSHIEEYFNNWTLSIHINSNDIWNTFKYLDDLHFSQLTVTHLVDNIKGLIGYYLRYYEDTGLIYPFDVEAFIARSDFYEEIRGKILIGLKYFVMIVRRIYDHPRKGAFIYSNYIYFILVHLLSLEKSERQHAFEQIVDYIEWDELTIKELNKFRLFWKQDKEKLKDILVEKVFKL